MFVGRKAELAGIRQELSSWERKTAILIYGKRRVGKSTLINQASNSFEGVVINHLCVSSTFEGNLELIYRSVSEALGLPPIHFDSLFAMMDFLKTQGKKFLLIIDEYSYLKQTKKQNEVDSYMQAVIDRLPENVKLILCGSYVAIMKELLQESNPLFGRFSLIQHIRDFDYYDSALFYPDLPVMDKVAYYTVFGGCPFVLANLNYNNSIEENIVKFLLTDNGIIRSHIENIMLNEIKKAFDTRILEVLANGKKRYSEIAGVLKIRETGLLEKQLKILLSMETIQKTEPINRRNENKKKFYEIVDNLMRFYFTFIFGNSGTISRIGEAQYYKMNVQGERLREFISRRFEGLVLQYFHRISGTGEFADIEDFGSYWYDDPKNKKNGEFDCVVKRKGNSGNSFDFYECKYFNRKMRLDECELEEAQIRQQSDIEPSKIGFICTGGFDFADEKYVLINGNDLYKNVADNLADERDEKNEEK